MKSHYNGYRAFIFQITFIVFNTSACTFIMTMTFIFATIYITFVLEFVLAYVAVYLIKMWFFFFQIWMSFFFFIFLFCFIFVLFFELVISIKCSFIYCVYYAGLFFIKFAYCRYWITTNTMLTYIFLDDFLDNFLILAFFDWSLKISRPKYKINSNLLDLAYWVYFNVPFSS